MSNTKNASAKIINRGDCVLYYPSSNSTATTQGTVEKLGYSNGKLVAFINSGEIAFENIISQAA